MFVIIDYIEVPLSNRYIRDGRAPIPLSKKTSDTFSKIHGKNTRPELFIRRGLWKNNLRGYRLWPKNIPGRPDICYTKFKIAIFVNGCFWHRCSKCNPPTPKTHEEFWKLKFENNIARDIQKIELLRNQGWEVIVVWECEIANNPELTMSEITDRIERVMDKKRPKLESC